ncbi:hydantoinase/oxoprolinase family protein [Desulfomonile tiedjei]|uniref:N-methylhydantoinase A/acetone carboxylase, beta subunit n=1 Tax=Desulfomonile tiedjei (strain ATCC 49306 / DSM 6799 / DCB-1) TaxID=706587 RepID=I4C4Q1_DESTA|nr:hydantoinase/oxoprolinase family protein [Desulfomonile tiedjei]AFM24542.1 N-methylhydantoinase A/acetone carboxylase, beta subunit [Desulfomonile tiedjei DSM 6799]
MKNGAFRLGCDIGGTFTDFVLVNDETGTFSIYKCLTTPSDPSDAIETGIRGLEKQTPGFMPHVAEIIHGTTLVINAIIERKGARTGLITTRGFKDILELGREIRYDAYDIFAEYPRPLVPRPLRKEVNERIASDGRILKALDLDDVKQVVQSLQDAKVESVAICLINSYENPEHEIKIKALVNELAPDLSISVSCEVLPQIREYERTSTTATNAYVKPITVKYLQKLSSRLQSLGFEGKLFIMLSSGSITTVATACEFPVRIIESGPTAAVIASQHYGRMFNIKDIFCFDMGGTTAKSCLIQKGEAGLVSTFEVGRVQRFKKGSGLPIQVPVVDLMEIGAGGGSIARISKMGLLQVGPESAGADPGPASYDLGGVNPTVTDADLILGYLDPDYFLGGTMPLNLDAARKAIEEKIAKPLNTTITDAAFGIHDLINETMAAAAKTHIAEKGGNPNTITVAAFGGAGPVHAYGLARKIGAPRLIVPPLAGVGSALGFFTAPVAFDLVRSHRVALDDADFNSIEKLFADLEKEASAILRQSGQVQDISFARSIDMRFMGQGAETNLPIPNKPFNQWQEREIRVLFDETYERLYGRTYPDTRLEFITFRVRASLPERPFRIPPMAASGGTLESCIKGQRQAYSLIQKKYVPFTVIDRMKLFPGAKIPGPVIIEEKESTIVVGEDAHAAVDDFGFVWITF